MTDLAKLEAHSRELAAMVQSLCPDFGDRGSAQADEDGVELPSQSPSAVFTHVVTPNVESPQPLVTDDTPWERHKAHRAILAHLSQLQTLLEQPSEFLQRLAKQNQVLACLRWLGHFQVLACIPLQDSVSISDVADLAGIPENRLARVVGMTATAGFLRQPRPGQVAHTALSAPFVTKPSLLDAALFLSETAGPAALHMDVATQRYGASQRPDKTAYNVAFQTATPFAGACSQRPRLQRQWPAYLRHGHGDVEIGMTEVLMKYDWRGLGSATVVDVGASSTATATALADLHPPLRFVVQMAEPRSSGAHLTRTASTAGTCGATTRTTPPSASGRPSPEITVQQRTPGSPQPLADAAVYILHLPTASPTLPSRDLPARILAELRAHLGVLSTNPRAALLLLAPSLLPEPGGGDAAAEAAARLRDLALWQLANDREMEVGEVLGLLDGVRDGRGWLAVVNRLTARHSPAVAFEVRYRAYADRQARLEGGGGQGLSLDGAF